VVKLIASRTSVIVRSNFPQQEMEFYLGSIYDQKLINFKILLKSDPQSSAQGLASVLTSCEEILIYQQTKTLKSRFSTFISSKIYG
jgi:hypothetical protein